MQDDEAFDRWQREGSDKAKQQANPSMQDRIKQLAVEADSGFGNTDGDMPDAIVGLDAINRFTQAIARECAKLADDYVWFDDPEKPSPDQSNEKIAKAIRARFGLKG